MRPKEFEALDWLDEIVSLARAVAHQGALIAAAERLDLEDAYAEELVLRLLANEIATRAQRAREVLVGLTGEREGVKM